MLVKRKNFINLVLASIFFLNIFHVGHAGRLRIEDESDFDRVANNVIFFWSDHDDAIELVAQNKLKSLEGLEVLEKIRLSKTGIAKEFREDRKQTKIDLENTFRHVKNNPTDVMSKLGEEKYQEFYNGLILLKRIAKYF